jgi:rhamnose utilization protein RhaD (predicted bifunctional aldolase and dehydrogenase)
MAQSRTISDEEGLLALSERVGSDPALVQGPGGNVSLKGGGVLWVKASGTWLAHARQKPIMVPLDLDRLRSAFEAGDPACESCVDFVRQDLNADRLRPSIETTFHAMMPQRVVVHVHCVETIATAARTDAAAVLAERLAGLNWALAEYRRPGVPLTRAIEAVRKPDTNVVVLANHGLVVAGETVEAAAALLADVSGRLRRPARPGGEPDLDRLNALASCTAYAPAQDRQAHAVALDPECLAVATGGSLYPDHVIFLGPGTVSLQDGESLADAERRAARPLLSMIAVPGAGVLLHESATAATQALAGCLSDVAARLYAGDPLHRLTEADEDALVNWDAEKYRQALARSGS